MPDELLPAPRARRRLPRRTLTGLVAMGAALGLVGSTAGCSIFEHTPDATPTATALAQDLAKGDLTGLPVDGKSAADASTSLQTATAALKNVPHTVTVANLDVKDQTAAATLAWTWTLTPAKTWSYTTPATLTLGRDQQWHVNWVPAMIAPGLTSGEKLALDQQAATRADILGADGAHLMTSRDVFQVGIDKGKLSDPAQAGTSATALAQLIGIDPVAYAKTVTAAGPQAFTIGLTLRTSDPIITGKAQDIAAIPGAVAIPATAVLGPTSTFARDLLGTVGPATAEIVAKSNGAISATDVVGLSGLEQRYDAQLRGTDGMTVRAVGTGGSSGSRELFRIDAVPGTPVSTSLDLDAQNAAQAAVDTLGGNPGGIAVIRASTGEVVAAASSPGANGQAVATTTQQAPGSTMKIVSSLALLRTGMTPTSTMSCTPTVTVNGRQFHNDSWYPASALGTIPMSLALAQSCNTAYISAAGQVSQQDLADAGAALGVGVDLDAGFPSFFGSIPVPDQGATDHAASMIGQGRVTGSPLSQATIIASVLKGATVRPHLVDGYPANPPMPAKPLTQPEVDALRTILGAVVQQGTAKGLAPLGVTLAKTGTAEYQKQDGTIGTHAWMVAGKGDLAVAVYVQDGQTGAGVAGPVVADFLQHWAG